MYERERWNINNSYLHPSLVKKYYGPGQFVCHMVSDSETDARSESGGSIPAPLNSPEGSHDPFSWYARQRNKGPVQYDTKRGVYDVFSYKHVKESLQDGQRLIRKDLSQDQDSPRDSLSYIGNAMIWSDGPRHTQIKSQLFSYFRPDLLTDMHKAIQKIAESQLDAALANGPDFDFVESFAAPVPLRVIMHMVGIPERDHQQMLKWLKTFREVMYSEYSTAGSSNGELMKEPVNYFKKLVARRSDEPANNDLISQLAAETDLTSEEIGANCFDFVLAGQGTMSEFLSNSLYLFAEHDLFGDFNQYDLDSVLEEVLRYRSPLQARVRQTTETLTIGGVNISPDETVILWLGAANRDPERYERSEMFVPERDPNHLAFGGGPHICIGAPLARLQAPIVLRTFIERFDEIDVDTNGGQPKSKASILGFEKLPVSTRPS